MSELQQKIRRHATHTSELYQMSDGDMGCPECDLVDRYARLQNALREIVAWESIPVHQRAMSAPTTLDVARAALEEKR